MRLHVLHRPQRGVTARPGNGRHVDFTRHGGLAAHGVVDAVVEQDMGEICQFHGPDDRHGPHVHEGGAVAVQAEHLPIGFLHGHAQRDLAAMPHAADSQKIPLPLVHSFAQLEHLARSHARGGNDDAMADGFKNMPDGVFTGHEVRRLLSRQGGNALKGALLDHEGERRIVRPHPFRRLVYDCVDVVRVAVEDGVGNFHGIEQIQRHPSLLSVLRFVLDAGFSTPSHDEQHGDTVDFGITQREQGIDAVAQPGILHVDHGDPSRS